MVYAQYNIRLWVKQIKEKPDAKAISLDGIDTTAAWRVESEEPIMEAAPDWLEDDHDDDSDHEISEDLDEHVPEDDYEIHAESTSVPPPEPQSQSQGDRPSGSTSSGRRLSQSLPPRPPPRGHHVRGSASSTSYRGRQSLV